jgi:hypothetical protein
LSFFPVSLLDPEIGGWRNKRRPLSYQHGIRSAAPPECHNL